MGRDMKAQGNALGKARKLSESPNGAEYFVGLEIPLKLFDSTADQVCGMCHFPYYAPLGLIHGWRVIPGRRPGLSYCAPFGAWE